MSATSNSKPAHHVIEWPEALQDGAEKVDPIPEGQEAVFLLVKYVGTQNDVQYVSRSVNHHLQTLSEDFPEVHIAYIPVTPRNKHYVPKQFYPLVRGLFDYGMNWARSKASK